MLLVNQCHDSQKEIYFLLLLVIKIYDKHYYEFRLNVDSLVMAANKKGKLFISFPFLLNIFISFVLAFFVVIFSKYFYMYNKYLYQYLVTPQEFCYPLNLILFQYYRYF